MPIWPFKRSPAAQDAEGLLQAVSDASRNPAFFGEGRAPDTLQGRFEIAALHAALALIRLRQTPDAAPLAQHFADQFFRWLDAGLREDGVGDLSVPKRMRALAGGFYGRLEAYATALVGGDARALTAALGRNVFGAEHHAFASTLGAYASATYTLQASLEPAELLDAGAWSVPIG